MAGGIKAWNGATASGSLEFGKAWFEPGVTGEEMAALAWILEEGSRLFYATMLDMIHEEPAASLLTQLMSAEQHHKNTLTQLYTKIAGHKPDFHFPHDIIHQETKEPMMEGGIPLRKALAWSKGKPIVEILELMAALEANALDLYIKMERSSSDKDVKEVFQTLADEERVHFEKLMQTYEGML